MLNKLAASFEVSAIATVKGELARRITWVVERIFGAPSRVFFAFIDEGHCKEADFTELFLIDLVRRAEGIFQPTIAVRVPPSPQT
ncbi:hypothetical protein GSI_10188 [Ganoderma sinense ZZ0214-1]|uniref:Uncharacterized protein n=1 Tax=Ganoderma sinense ZZ0214-1 TaxID=1077348 RepID=A0A2G8RZV1_9APHY|nr:hypothetical protein GSI_10188 [Ganoderma sinense ZZ0214-1]